MKAEAGSSGSSAAPAVEEAIGMSGAELVCRAPVCGAPAPSSGPREAALEQCPLDGPIGDWWVVHTKARQEKALAGDLDKRGIGCFLPLVRAMHRHGGRKVLVQLPLFPSYLFMCGGEAERYSVLMTHRAATVIPVADQEQLKRELRQIHLVITSEEPVDLFPGLKAGCRCRIVRGSLRGIEGVVVRRRDVCRVYLNVEVLGQSAEAEVDPSSVEVID